MIIVKYFGWKPNKYVPVSEAEKKRKKKVNRPINLYPIGTNLSGWDTHYPKNYYFLRVFLASRSMSFHLL